MRRKFVFRQKINYFLKLSAFDFHWLNWNPHIPLSSRAYHYKVGIFSNIWKFVKIFTKKQNCREELFYSVYCTTCRIPQLKPASEFPGSKHQNTKEREAFWWDCDSVSFLSYLKTYLYCHTQKFSECIGFQVLCHVVSQLCVRARTEHLFCLMLEKETWVQKPGAGCYTH